MSKLAGLIKRYQNNIQFSVGYPQNIHFDYSAIFPALSYPINNYGDPFLLNNPVSSHEYEREVIRWFLQLFGLPDPKGWGYVTTGGTEGILFGAWQAKENLNNPVIYFSEYAHYAAIKTAKLMGLEYRVIQATEQGEMNYEDFDNKLIKSRDAIVVATLGNTITSAIDNVSVIRSIADKHAVKLFIHADAAFDGMILPFIDSQHVYRLSDGIDSISISGHKIMGSPIPCGVVLIHQKYIQHTKRAIDYINNFDCTITGSRCGFAALILWDAIYKNKRAGFKVLIAECRVRAAQFTKILNERGVQAWRLDHALTIVLDKLPDALTRKWRAPSNHAYTTLTALPKLTEAMLQALIDDIQYFEQHHCLRSYEVGIAYPRTSSDIELETIE